MSSDDCQEKMVTITQEEYDNLCKDSEKLVKVQSRMKWLVGKKRQNRLQENAIVSRGVGNQMATYKNKFHFPQYQDSKPYITTNAVPVKYKGYLIYHRVEAFNPSANVFDVVDKGICIGAFMDAGINGAKKFIDEIRA